MDQEAVGEAVGEGLSVEQRGGICGQGFEPAGALERERGGIPLKASYEV